MGAALRRLERRQDAVEAYSLALAKFPRGRHADTEWFERLAVLAISGENNAVLDELAKRPDPPAKVADRAWSYGCEAAIAVTNYPRAIEYATLVTRQPEGATVATAVHRLAWLYEKTGDWARAAKAAAKAAEVPKAASVARKLSYKETRELEALPGKMEALEAEIADIESTLADPAIYAQDNARATALTARLPLAREELDAAENRWLELSERA